MGNPNPSPDNRFKPGESGNPEGRPKGLSITALVREALEKVPEGQKQKAKDLLVKRIMHKAISDGDTKLIEKVWEYMDGKPVQRNKIDGSLEIKTAMVEFLDGENKSTDTE